MLLDLRGSRSMVTENPRIFLSSGRLSRSSFSCTTRSGVLPPTGSGQVLEIFFLGLSFEPSCQQGQDSFTTAPEGLILLLVLE